MNSLVRAFLLDRRSQGATPKTMRWHETALGKFCTYLDTIDTPPANQWTNATLRGFIVYLQDPQEGSDKKLAPASVRTYVNSIWAFVRWLYEEEIIEKNLAEKVKKPRVPKTNKSAFTELELKLLLDAASKTTNGGRDLAILTLMLDTGMRAQEVCNLTVADFHHEEQVMTVKQGKGRKDRITPISPKTALRIHRYLAKDRSMTLRNEESLFIAKRGSHLSPSGLIQLVKRIAIAAGVEDVHPHRFRHTSALYFLRNGGDPLTLQRILGHTTLEMTNRYLNMLSEDLSRVHAQASPVTNLK